MSPPPRAGYPAPHAAHVVRPARARADHLDPKEYVPTENKENVPLRGCVAFQWISAAAGLPHLRFFELHSWLSVYRRMIAVADRPPRLRTDRFRIRCYDNGRARCLPTWPPTLPLTPFPSLPHATLSYPTLPYPTLPYPTLPYPTLPDPTLPYNPPPPPAHTHTHTHPKRKRNRDRYVRPPAPAYFSHAADRPPIPSRWTRVEYQKSPFQRPHRERRWSQPSR